MTGAEKPQAIAAGASATLLLRPRKTKYIFFAGFGVFIALVGIAVAISGDWAGWPILGLGIVVCACCILFMSPRFLSLELRADGFTIHSGFKSRSLTWDEVGLFRTDRIHGGGTGAWSRAVVFDLGDNGPRSRAGAIRGWDMFLPERYGMKVDELATLMNNWRKRCRSGG